MNEPKILTLHPSGKQGVNILLRRYEVIKDFILLKLKEHSEISFDELTDLAIIELSDKYESFELYNPSGDSYNEAYLFAPKSEQHLFEVRTGDNFDNGLIHGNIEKIEGDSFWIENHNEEMSIEYNIYNDLIAFRNYFLSSRKIGMTVKIFFDQENLVSQVWIEFVYGEKNAIHSLHLSQDGRIVLKLEDNITY